MHNLISPEESILIKTVIYDTENSSKASWKVTMHIYQTQFCEEDFKALEKSKADSLLITTLDDRR